MNREEAAESAVIVEAMSPVAGVPCESPSSFAAASPVSLQAKTLSDQPPNCALQKECAAILAALEHAGGRIAKRLLQKKLWRIRAERFNHVIRSLVEQKSIRVEGNMLTASQKNENATAVTGDGGI